METNKPQRQREPELREITMAYEDNLNKMEGLIHDLKNKVSSIYNPPQAEIASKNPLSNQESVLATDDIVSELNSKNKRLERQNERLQDVLNKLSIII